MNKAAKQVVRQAERLGYALVSQNSKGARRYEHPTAEPIVLQPTMSDDTARTLSRQLAAVAGIPVQVAKRNPAAVRERQARERVQHRADAERHEQELAALRAERARLLGGHGVSLTDVEVSRIETEMERSERELARLRRLMTETPSSAEHRSGGRAARHQAGAR